MRAKDGTCIRCGSNDMYIVETHADADTKTFDAVCGCCGIEYEEILELTFSGVNVVLANGEVEWVPAGECIQGEMGNWPRKGDRYK